MSCGAKAVMYKLHSVYTCGSICKKSCFIKQWILRKREACNSAYSGVYGTAHAFMVQQPWLRCSLENDNIRWDGGLTT